MDAYIVDFKPVIKRYSACKELYRYYTYVSLSEIIESLLAISIADIDTASDIIVADIVSRSREPLRRVEMKNLNVFIEVLLSDLDEVLSEHIEHSRELVFYGWLDSTSIILVSRLIY